MHSPNIFAEPVKVKKAHPRKRANDLDGKTWLKYSISVWNDIKKSPEEMKLKHPAMFPAQLARRLIEMFLPKEQKIVLDPFLGIGSTLIAAQQMNKIGIGFEISSEYVEIARNRIARQTEIFDENENNQTVYHEDARNLRKHLQKDSVDICITSPPYWDILSQKRTADNKAIKDYEEKVNNLGNITNYRKFLEELASIFCEVFYVLKQGAYCIIVVMDIRKKAKFYPYHLDIISFMQTNGFILDDTIIWDRRADYNELRPLGYPSVFRVNKIHEYVLIFQKPIRRRGN